MAFSKSIKFSKANQYTALLCQALSHPARIYIINEIVSGHGDAVSYQQITKKMPLAKSTISQHFAYLRKMDIIMPDANNPSLYAINTKLNNTLLALLYLVTFSGNATPNSIIVELKALSRAR